MPHRGHSVSPSVEVANGDSLGGSRARRRPRRMPRIATMPTHAARMIARNCRGWSMSNAPELAPSPRCASASATARREGHPTPLRATHETPGHALTGRVRAHPEPSTRALTSQGVENVRSNPVRTAGCAGRPGRVPVLSQLPSTGSRAGPAGLWVISSSRPLDRAVMLRRNMFREGTGDPTPAAYTHDRVWSGDAARVAVPRDGRRLRLIDGRGGLRHLPNRPDTSCAARHRSESPVRR
jgi:hypothetical protein